MADEKKGGFDPKVMLKSITTAVKDWGRIQGERSKIQAELLSNEMEKRQNWLWKMKEKQASPQYQMQQQLGQMFQRQQGGGTATMAPGADVFAGKVQPDVRIGKGGYEVNYPSQKEFIYSRIQQKKQRQMPLSEKEKKFEEQYLGIRDKEKKDYLLKIPPKEIETKSKGFWPRFGDAMIRNLTGGVAGAPVTEATRTGTIEEVKRKYKAGEALSPEEATLLTMNNIKTKQDIEELLENREQYESQGVDVERILEFFTTEEE